MRLEVQQVRVLHGYPNVRQRDVLPGEHNALEQSGIAPPDDNSRAVSALLTDPF